MQRQRTRALLLQPQLLSKASRNTHSVSSQPLTSTSYSRSLKTRSGSHRSQWGNALTGIAAGVGVYALLAKGNFKKKKLNKPMQEIEGQSEKKEPTSTLAMMNRLDNIKMEELFKLRPGRGDLDVYAGNTEIIREVVDVVRFLQDPEEFKKTKIILPKGILLSGPPGVGKTFLAEAIAGHANVPIIMVCGSDFSSKYVGEAEKKLRAVFELARKQRCVLCIDEIDAVGSKRVAVDRSSDMYANAIVIQLIKLLEEDNSDVVIIAATNCIEKLDPAIVRSGRFDRHIRMSLPDQNDRVSILSVYTKDKKLAANVSLHDLGILSRGYTGADIKTWVNTAATIAARKQAEIITQEDFNEARIVKQLGTRKKTADPIQKKRIALHEAAHALVGHELKRQVYMVTTESYGNVAGFTEYIPEENESSNPTKQQVLDKICSCLAGRAGEKILNEEQLGSLSDLGEAKILAKGLVAEGLYSTLSGVTETVDVEEILQKEMLRAIEILNKNKETWQHLIDALVEHDKLSREDFLKIIEGGKITKANQQGWSFFRFNNKGKERKPELVIPPKSKTISNPLTPTKGNTEALTKHNFPSIEAIAKALKVDPNCIRGIDEYASGLRVKFKPGFSNHKHMESMSKKLSQENVEHLYSSRGGTDHAELYVWQEGVEDFLRYVEANDRLDDDPEESYFRFGYNFGNFE